MSGPCGSRDVWVDPTLAYNDNQVEWVDPSTGSKTDKPQYSGEFDVPSDFLPIWSVNEPSCWEGDEWTGDPLEETGHTFEFASRTLADILLAKFNAGKWYAADICKMAYWVKAMTGGRAGPAAELSKRPGLPTGHYNKHMKVITGVADEDETLDHLEMPCSDSGDGSRISYRLPVIPPHEHLNREMGERREVLEERLASHVRGDKLPPIYTEHPVTAKTRGRAQPIALYIDGVPTTKTDGVLGIWVYFCLSEARHLVAVIQKSRLCKCGCKGWCSLWVVFSWLAWSLGLMAEGVHAAVDWNGKPIKGCIRQGLKGFKLLFAAALCAIKGEWLEFCSTFAFSNWQTRLSPCYGCWCTKANYLDDALLDADSLIWPDFTMQDYLDACTACEVLVTVTTIHLLRRIRASLFYDRRKKGMSGRSLRWNIQDTLLLQGDRLEPTQSLPDVALIDGLRENDLPVVLTFWRANQTRVKHRNPLFDQSTGVTPELMAADQLHALNMGALQRFSAELLWTIIWANVWGARKAVDDQSSWLDQCLIAMRAALTAWEGRFHDDSPVYKATKVQKMGPGHIGKPTSRCLKLKAAETKMLFLFLHDQVQSVWGRLHMGRVWLSAADNMYGLSAAISSMPWKLSRPQYEDCAPATSGFYLQHNTEI